VKESFWEENHVEKLLYQFEMREGVGLRSAFANDILNFGA
jgi:hypothetical protein